MVSKKLVQKSRVSFRASDEPSSIEGVSQHSLAVYRRIAVSFVLLVLATLFTVLYLASVSAVIYVESTQEPLTTQFIATIRESTKASSDVSGQVGEVVVRQTKTFTPDVTTADTKTIDQVATGTVEIFNNLSIAQPLIEKTRLLSKEGVLFRLVDGVNVPAKGRVTAQVFADVVGVSGNSDPTTFTIPGLSEERQKQVTATSVQAFTGGVKTVSVVSQVMIDTAKMSLREQLVTQAQGQLLSAQTGGLTGAVYTNEVVNEQVSVEAGIEVGSFDITMELRVIGVFFEKDRVERVAMAKLAEGLGQGQALGQVDASRMKAEIERVDAKTGEANVRFMLDGHILATRTNDALDVGKFVGMNEEEVRHTLLSSGLAKSVEVEFFPFWIKRVPSLKDHITIEIR